MEMRSLFDNGSTVSIPDNGLVGQDKNIKIYGNSKENR